MGKMSEVDALVRGPMPRSERRKLNFNHLGLRRSETRFLKTLVCEGSVRRRRGACINGIVESLESKLFIRIIRVPNMGWRLSPMDRKYVCALVMVRASVNELRSALGRLS